MAMLLLCTSVGKWIMTYVVILSLDKYLCVRARVRLYLSEFSFLPLCWAHWKRRIRDSYARLIKRSFFILSSRLTADPQPDAQKHEHLVQSYSQLTRNKASTKQASVHLCACPAHATVLLRCRCERRSKTTKSLDWISYSRDQNIACWLFFDFVVIDWQAAFSCDLVPSGVCRSVFSIALSPYNCVTSTLRRLRLSEERERKWVKCVRLLAPKMWSLSPSSSSGVIICSLKSRLHNIVRLIEQRRRFRMPPPLLRRRIARFNEQILQEPCLVYLCAARSLL